MKTTILLLATLASAAVAQDLGNVPYSAETYGGASGDTPLQGLGLVLELVDGQTASPMLRLFGGPAGQNAKILVSMDSAATPGPRGMTRLVGGYRAVFEGSFDWMGYYEVPLEVTYAEGSSFFAQGVHTGIFDLAGEGQPLVQLSNGLHVFTEIEEEDAGLGLDDLRPHLPEVQGILPPTTPLAERLQAYLNSEGDSTSIKLHVEGSGGAGANAGAQIEHEFKVERKAEGVFELTLASDLAAKAGVEAVEGVEANVKGGYGATRVFRFNSAHGAARGIFGMMMSTQHPNLTPGRWIADSGLLGDPADGVEALTAAVELAKAHAEKAETLLWYTLDIAVENAETRRDRAVKGLRRAMRGLASARPRHRPYWALQVFTWSVRVAANQTQLVVCRVARNQGEALLNVAKRTVEEQREKLRAALAALARIPRIVSALAQLRGYTTDHYVGTELRTKQSVGAEIGIPLPVKVASLGAGIERELEMTVSVLFEKETEHSRRKIVVTRQLEDDVTASAACLLGAEYERKLAGSLVESFEFGLGQGFSKTTTANVSRDVLVRGLAGQAVALGAGVGRKREFSLERDFTIDEDFELGAFLLGENRDTLIETEVGTQLQDRLVRTIECDLIISIGGNGGGFEIDIEWTDQGEAQSHSKTIQEAIVDVIDGVDELLDPESDTVATN